MGAWSEESFGNDTANDWAYGLDECDDLSYIKESLQRVLEVGGDYLEAPDAEEAIAAAEVLAWLNGGASAVDAYTEKIAAWIAAHPLQPPRDLLEKAISVLDRIQQKPSELLELWEGNEDWPACMADLRRRLVGG